MMNQYTIWSGCLCSVLLLSSCGAADDVVRLVANNADDLARSADDIARNADDAARSVDDVAAGAANLGDEAARATQSEPVVIKDVVWETATDLVVEVATPDNIYQVYVDCNQGTADRQLGILYPDQADQISFIQRVCNSGY